MHKLALFLFSLGYSVSGYDKVESKNTTQLEFAGIKVYYKPNINHLKNVDVVVINGAISETHKELKYAREHNITIIDRAELLYKISCKFKYVIAVSGTHGKTTTANMIYHILRNAGLKVSCHIGAEIENDRLCIDDDYLVVEACEFNRSFLKLKPYIGIVLNVEPEHLDCYKNFNGLKNAFSKFLKQSKNKFVLYSNNTKFLKSRLDCNWISSVGNFNKKNKEVAVSVCEFLGIDKVDANNFMQSYSPAKRRQEVIGHINGFSVLLDYAHHPTEVNEFIHWFGTNNMIIFQPHTYSRTKLLFKEFLNVFKNLDNIIIYKEYPAREKKGDGVTAKQLFKSLKLLNNKALYFKNAFKLKRYIYKFAKSKIAFVGAGDIDKVAKFCIKSKKNLKPVDKMYKV